MPNLEKMLYNKIMYNIQLFKKIPIIKGTKSMFHHTIILFNSLDKHSNVTYLWGTNSNTDIYIVSIDNIIPINDRINNRLILEPTDSSLEYSYKTRTDM